MPIKTPHNFMEKAKCMYCKKRTDEPWFSLIPICDSCYENKVKPENAAYASRSKPMMVEVMHLAADVKCTKAQWNEMNRRVVLNDNGSTYDVGRRGDNGKVQDRTPNYL